MKTDGERMKPKIKRKRIVFRFLLINKATTSVRGRLPKKTGSTTGQVLPIRGKKCQKYEAPACVAKAGEINVIELSHSACIYDPDVIPAKAGIQSFGFFWTPAFAGVTVLCIKMPLKLTTWATIFGCRL